VKLWVLSDIHLELTTDWDLPGPADRPDFDVLVMAGDLVPQMERGVKWLVERVPDRPIVYIAGNHEAYRADIDRTLQKAKLAAAGSNVFVMEDETTVIGGVRFVAGTLWTDFQLFGDPEAAMRAAGANMNDYRLIRTNNYARRLSPTDTLARHRSTQAYIESELARTFGGQTVVVTHHGPYLGAMRQGHERDIISAAYVSDLSSLIEQHQPAVWIYGHTHRSDDTMIGRTRIVSNSKGYGPHPALRLTTWENSMFNPSLVIEV
jgi:predicted phosphodiesterase